MPTGITYPDQTGSSKGVRVQAYRAVFTKSELCTTDFHASVRSNKKNGEKKQKIAAASHFGENS